jgi:hypothetical protein
VNICREPLSSVSVKKSPPDRQTGASGVGTWPALTDGSHRGGDGVHRGGDDTQEAAELDAITGRGHLVSGFNLPRRMRPVTIGFRRTKGRGRSQRAVAMAEQHKEESHPLRQAPQPRVLLVVQAGPVPPGGQHTGVDVKIARKSQDRGLNKSWQNDTDCCKWNGISCSPDRMLTDVVLASRSLQIHLVSSNLLSGSLTLELVSSSNIIVLDVSFNQLNGGLQELPSSTPPRPLKVLNISSNLFFRQFPSSTWEVMKSWGSNRQNRTRDRSTVLHG